MLQFSLVVFAIETLDFLGITNDLFIMNTNGMLICNSLSAEILVYGP